ncbi:MAG: flagellar export chaperone FliS [Nitrospirae bacterium]|nr:flagellar export chaperone FliS [Nitrospirota bacterium]
MEQTISAKQGTISEDEKIKTVSLLYDGALKFLQAATVKLNQGDSYGAERHIKKASAIIRELASSLNMDGGEIALNLKRLYDYVLNSLLRAEQQRDIAAIEGAERVIVILRDAWKEIEKGNA